ncbi:MAG TPA: GNAT family N-acetyltransferase [Actinomycetales bacterium]|nr:GNAT family N-acetyltransferase [Actinomycetales bacterium]
MRIRPGGLEDAAAINQAGLRINTRVRPKVMMVAEDEDGSILGFAYRFRSQMHPTRYWATVRVREDARRKGLGTLLLAEIAKSRENPFPFYIRVREDNPALEWARTLGGKVFQENPPMEIPLNDVANLEWLRQLPDAPEGVQIVSAAELDHETVLNAFLDTYRWVHEDWSAPASREIVESVYGADLHDDLDRDISSFAVRGLGTPEQEVLAGIYTFPESSTALDAVGETVARDTPDADQIMAAVLKRTARAATEKNYEVLDLDGYASDIHLEPLVRSAPTVNGTALVWMEYDAPAEDPQVDAGL